LEGFHSTEYDGKMTMNVESSILAFTLFEETTKISLRTTGNVAEIQTAYFPNTSLEHCHSSILLSAEGIKKHDTRC
jgi:hypothetical protein